MLLKKCGREDFNAEMLMELIDTDKDSKINYDEWCSFINARPPKAKPGEFKVPSKKVEKLRKARELPNMISRLNKERQRLAKLAAEKAAEQAKKDLLDAQERAAQLERERAERRKAARAREEELKRQQQEHEAEMQRVQNELEESLERERERSKKMKERRERKMERPKDNAVVHWRPYHVAEWISDVLELPQYSQNFTENSVDGLLLCSLTDTDLKKFIRIRARLHRAKILVHVQRLRELSGISDIVSTSPRKAGAASRNAKSSGADVAWGGTGIPGSPELIRAKIRKHTGKVKKQKAVLDAQDRTHSRYWPLSTIILAMRSRHTVQRLGLWR